MSTADAVYLTKTLEFLLKQNILMLATSNYAPDELLPDPLFHDRFLPAINLIKSQLEVVSLGPGADYRRTVAGQNQTGFHGGQWHVHQPASTAAPQSDIQLIVNGLPVRAVAAEKDVVTLTFAELCERPLGTNEYLRLAEDFGRICLIAVPDLAGASGSSLSRLSNLVDVLYDRDQQLDVQASAGTERMLEGAEAPCDAPRTLSRLATLALSSPP